MTKYAIIDNHSGFVWGAAIAASPIDACRIIDADADPSAAAGRTYEEVPRSELQSGYLVYIVADDFDVIDGQDPAAIEAVEASRFVAAISTGD